MPGLELIPSCTWEEIVDTIYNNPELTFGLAGPPGLGKTSLWFALAEMLEKQPYKVQLHDELSPSELMGVLVPGSKAPAWVPGPGDNAYAQGGLLILDEIDKSSGPCKTYMYSLLDKGPGGTISYLGRDFVQEEDYQAGATMNGDPNDGSLDMPILDRFAGWFTITQPRKELMALLNDSPDLKLACKRAYKNARNPLVGPDFTFRQYLHLGSLRETLPLDKAVLVAARGQQGVAKSVYESLVIIGDGTDPEDVDAEDD